MSKKILFLSGYDYSHCFKSMELSNVYLAIPANDPVINNSVKSNYAAVFGTHLREVEYKQQDLVSLLDEIQPDVLISFGWRRIIKSETVQRVPLKINIHPAILPQYKGYHPVPYVLMNNEAEHGITAHIMTDELDGGDIILVEKFPINKFSTLRSLQYSVNKLMPEFLESLKKVLDAGNYSMIKNIQENTKIVAARRTPEDSEIDSSKPLTELYDSIRSCDDERFPAFFYVNGEKVFIKLTRNKADKENPFDI